MSYLELRDLLNSFPTDRLGDDVSIYIADEFYPLQNLVVSVDNGVLDDGHIYLTVDTLFEEDEVYRAPLP